MRGKKWSTILLTLTIFSPVAAHRMTIRAERRQK
jgi:hypothetical protein